MKVTRRSAMKSLASALCLSQVRVLLPEQPTAIPWEFFCDQTDWIAGGPWLNNHTRQQAAEQGA